MHCHTEEHILQASVKICGQVRIWTTDNSMAKMVEEARASSKVDALQGTR